MAFQTIEGKLYKLHLDNWEPFIKAMDDDFNKINEFKFHHPQNTHKEFFRHYVYLPANGCTFMMVGQMRKAEDSACVRIVIHSVNFKDSYLAIYDYEHCFRNPDLMAGMLVHGFNESLKGTGLRMTFEPWDTMGKDIRWLDDHELTYNINYHRTMGKHVSKMGMFNYCWPGCLTVMYDVNKIGLVQIEDIKKNNDYAIWLKVCKKADCYLLNECLAHYRKRKGSISNQSKLDLVKWHYRLFREAEKQNVIESAFNTVRNVGFGVMKKVFYVKSN